MLRSLSREFTPALQQRVEESEEKSFPKPLASFHNVLLKRSSPRVSLTDQSLILLDP